MLFALLLKLKTKGFIHKKKTQTEQPILLGSHNRRYKPHQKGFTRIQQKLHQCTKPSALWYRLMRSRNEWRYEKFAVGSTNAKSRIEGCIRCWRWPRWRNRWRDPRLPRRGRPRGWILQGRWSSACRRPPEHGCRLRRSGSLHSALVSPASTPKIQWQKNVISQSSYEKTKDLRRFMP